MLAHAGLLLVPAALPAPGEVCWRGREGAARLDGSDLKRSQPRAFRIRRLSAGDRAAKPRCSQAAAAVLPRGGARKRPSAQLTLPSKTLVTLMHWYRLERDTGGYNREFAVHSVVRGAREGARCNDLLGKVAAQHAASSLPRIGTSAAAAGCREAVLHLGCCWGLLELVASAAQSSDGHAAAAWC